MEGPAQQPGQAGGCHGFGVVVATLNHRQRRLADGEHIPRLQHCSGVMPQNGGRVIEHPQQVGANRQHLAAFPRQPLGLGGNGGGWTPQRHQQAIAAPQPPEGPVVHPEDLQPEGVQQHRQIHALGCGDR